MGGRRRTGLSAKGKTKVRTVRTRGAKHSTQKARRVAPKPKAKAKVAVKPAVSAPKPAPKPAPRPAAPSEAVAAPKGPPPPKRIERKEATSMADQAKCPIHNSPDCFKPALDAYVQKAYDGYCTKIDWPFVRIIPKGWKPG
jgi:hypothetical protein